MSRTYSEWTDSAWCLVYWVRAKAGLRTYLPNSNLLDSAYKKASDISMCQPHPLVDSVSTACGRPVDYHVNWTMRCAGFAFAENIYFGAHERSTPRAAVQAWLDSPQRRAKLLSWEFTHHGVMYSGPTTYPL